jgi:hypothetical protein
MKMQLQSMLLLMGVSLSIFTACKKHDRIENTNITETFTTKAVDKEGIFTYTGTFTATGGLIASGTNLMTTRVTTDSSFCVDVLTTPNGSFTTHQNCSRGNMTGEWEIVSGTGIYRFLHGSGQLTMMFPPNVPAGVFVIEALTGEISQ